MGTTDAVGGAQGTPGPHADTTFVASLAARTRARDSGDNSVYTKNQINVILTLEFWVFFLPCPCVTGDKSLSTKQNHARASLVLSLSI